MLIICFNIPHFLLGTPEVLTAAELFARRELKLTEKKEMIAEIAMLVIEDPEENVR